MQTRKHFQAAIDNVVSAMNVSVQSNADTEHARRQAAITLQFMANGFAGDTPRFDREKFAATAATLIGGRETFNVIMDHVINPSQADYS